MVADGSRYVLLIERLNSAASDTVRDDRGSHGRWRDSTRGPSIAQHSRRGEGLIAPRVTAFEILCINLCITIMKDVCLPAYSVVQSNAAVVASSCGIGKPEHFKICLSDEG